MNGEVNLESLTKRLWRLRDLEAPPELKARLLSSISLTGNTCQRRNWMHKWVRNCAVAAAAVVFLAAAVCLLIYGGRASTPTVVADSNDGLRRPPMTDQNNAPMADMNAAELRLNW